MPNSTPDKIPAEIAFGYAANAAKRTGNFIANHKISAGLVLAGAGAAVVIWSPWSHANVAAVKPSAHTKSTTSQTVENYFSGIGSEGDPVPTCAQDLTAMGDSADVVTMNGTQVAKQDLKPSLVASDDLDSQLTAPSNSEATTQQLIKNICENDVEARSVGNIEGEYLVPTNPTNPSSEQTLATVNPILKSGEGDSSVINSLIKGDLPGFGQAQTPTLEAQETKAWISEQQYASLVAGFFQDSVLVNEGTGNLNASEYILRNLPTTANLTATPQVNKYTAANPNPNGNDTKIAVKYGMDSKIEGDICEESGGENVTTQVFGINEQGEEPELTNTPVICETTPNTPTTPTTPTTPGTPSTPNTPNTSSCVPGEDVECTPKVDTHTSTPGPDPNGTTDLQPAPDTPAILTLTKTQSAA